MQFELVKQWLVKSEDDYISATVLMKKVQPPQIEIACYHSRYPNNIDILESEAESALVLAKKIYDFVEHKIC